jgi:hypothetical protein
MDITPRLLIAALGGLIVAVAVCLRLRARARIKEAEKWPTGEGRILASALTHHETDETIVYQATIRYAYRIGDEVREGQRVRLLRDGRTASRASAEAVVARYPVGATISVRYDPVNAGTACLELDAPPPSHPRLGALGLVVMLASLLLPN